MARGSFSMLQASVSNVNQVLASPPGCRNGWRELQGRCFRGSKESDTEGKVGVVVKWFCVPGKTQFETVTNLAGRGQREAAVCGWLNTSKCLHQRACHVSEKRSKVSRKNGVYSPGSFCPIDVTSNRWLEYSLPVFTSVRLAGISHLTAEG